MGGGVSAGGGAGSSTNVVGGGGIMGDGVVSASMNDRDKALLPSPRLSGIPGVPPPGPSKMSVQLVDGR